MRNQLIIHIEGYPDEVVVPALAIGVDVETEVVSADVAGINITAEVDVPEIPGEE